MLCMEDGSIQHIIKCANDPMLVQKACQDHINSIFHYSDTYDLIISMKCGGPLPNITNVSKIQIKDETVDPQFLKNVLTTYSDHHSLIVHSKIVGDLPKNSPFFQVQNVVADRSGPDYFHNFVGRKMFLTLATVTEQDLIPFLQKWISNEAYHNLETLYIITRKRINVDLIRQSIEFEEYDPNEPEKRPAQYVIEIPYVGPISRVYHLGHEFVEIKRITDGKRAFLSVGVSYFRFFVHKN
ncbi:Protein CBG11405 [Caenorhabditis briggsae]|uniref:Protein CBG11405 n=1 Tax=Caenorhabditis briggsae TaxID=6238 RepID=A8XD38_CAEBR|nr:Protein CBG11405 [Caenorhabditis briggsae]CAP30557.1 Protein CBG11405 [Caenorhabditis briggsae]